MTSARSIAAAALSGIVLWSAAVLSAEPVAVRYAEGDVHGFLVLRTLDGKMLADGDLVEAVRGTRVTSRLAFHFKDGSEYEETTVFSQSGHFRLISDRVVQKGPSFPQPMTMTIDADAGRAEVHWTGHHGGDQRHAEQLDLRPDLANGLLITLFRNMRPSAPPASLSFVAATPKPRLVKLAISVAGREPFSVGGSRRTAVHYVVKVELGGLSGLVAPLVGKQPPDSHVWITTDAAPAFVKSEQPLYVGGPVWRIELASPTWSSAAVPVPTRPDASQRY